MQARNLPVIDPDRRDPLLPPGFSLVGLREAGDAFAHAQTIAGEAGAATLVWVRRFDLVELAVVLEPDAPLSTARLAHYLGMNALADALAAHCPPERPIVFRWPDALLYDAGLIGGGRTAWPEHTAEDAVPDWIVFGGMLRASSRVDWESGERGDGVAMDEEGFEDVAAVDLVESFARHLMLGVHEWTTKGPRAVCKRWLERLEKPLGIRHGIAPNGDLIVSAKDGETRRGLVEALARADWYDAANAEPKL